MYIEKRYMKKIGKVFEALSIPLRLVDASGACLVPEDGEPASLPAGVLAQGLNHHAGRYFFRVLDVHPPLYLVAPESAPGAEDVLCVADAMIMSLLKSIFHPGDSIHMFRRLMLERFLMNVPREESMLYHSLLFSRKTAKLFNEEMLQTIEMFFRKDLNLSDTARQLFIHRNTLVYRLDKVQRQTGLDLRHFDDAVTFKILYELKKCGQEKPRQIY